MSESHVHVTVGFPFSEILIGHLVCLSSFAVCLLTSTLGISGQAAKRPQVCLFWQSCGKSAVLQLCGSKWEQWSQILMEDSCISRGLQPTRDSPKLLCIFFYAFSPLSTALMESIQVTYSSTRFWANLSVLHLVHILLNLTRCFPTWTRHAIWSACTEEKVGSLQILAFAIHETLKFTEFQPPWATV